MNAFDDGIPYFKVTRKVKVCLKLSRKGSIDPVFTHCGGAYGFGAVPEQVKVVFKGNVIQVVVSG